MPGVASQWVAPDGSDPMDRMLVVLVRICNSQQGNVTGRTDGGYCLVLVQEPAIAQLAHLAVRTIFSNAGQQQSERRTDVCSVAGQGYHDDSIPRRRGAAAGGGGGRSGVGTAAHCGKHLAFWPDTEHESLSGLITPRAGAGPRGRWAVLSGKTVPRAVPGGGSRNAADDCLHFFFESCQARTCVF